MSILSSHFALFYYAMITYNSKFVLSILVTVLSLFVFLQSASAETKFRLKPHLMLGEMEGDLSTSGVAADVDLGWDETLEKANGALLIDFEVRNEDFSVLSQLWYTSLSDTEPKISTFAFDQAKQDFEAVFLTEVIGLNIYNEEGSIFDLTFGGRLASVSNDLTVRRNGTEENYDQNDLWVDPIVGFNTMILLDEGYLFHLGGDYGGFDVSSSSTWQAWTAIDFSLTPKAAFSVGYRALSHDYESGDFKYNMNMRGPTLGFEFHF
jgi:hypothetical protein